MANDSGSLSLSDRLDRIEGEQVELRDKVTKIEIELGKSNTKLAVVMTVIFTVVTAALQLLLK